MSITSRSTEEFRKALEALPREDLLEIIKDQDPKLIEGIERIEYVFENKLNHLTWSDGMPIEGRPLTQQELALLVDEPFTPSADLTQLGLSIEEQRKLHIAKDPVLWAKHFLGINPRVYQILMLRYPSLRKVLRAGRRLGKTFTMSILLLHYSYTTKNGRAIVVAPMKTHVELIYQEMMKYAKDSPLVMESITRKVTSPQFAIEFSNGSTIRFFTSGLRSGGKSDVARGQEAHIIVLDEMDYMHPDDLTALYAMLQKTDDNQADKILIAASTPTGRRERFFEWCSNLDGKGMFKEFWFPSYCNPHFTKETEEEFRAEYSEMGYRHEVEADWGEDTEGVYPRRYIDAAFKDPGWEYIPNLTSASSKYFIGVDWNKFSAGTNAVVLEMPDSKDTKVEERFLGHVRVCHREEMPKDEYSLTKAVDRIIDLNYNFRPEWIYVDQGYGEVQIELLHKYGQENPFSGLRTRVKGINFAGTVEVRDPATKQRVKKELKPFMVDNLRQMLEGGVLLIPTEDDGLYRELLSYVVQRVTPTGKPIFEAAGSASDHAHDALILACHAINENYGELMKANYGTMMRVTSNEAFLKTFVLSDSEGAREREEEMIEEQWGGISSAPVQRKRALTLRPARSRSRPISRRMF